MKAAPNPPRYAFDSNIWEAVSSGCPLDTDWLLDGIENGFHIGLPNTTDLARSTVRNLPTTVDQKIAICKWINEKREKGALWGPWRSTAEMPKLLEGVRVSPLGCVPKGDHYGKQLLDKEWRVIHHLSHPRNGDSVNSLIDNEFKEVNHVKFREVVEMMLLLGVGALIWTIDAKDAYLRVPIKETCYKHMGFFWMGLYYVFTCLSFGLASACRIYTRFADWVLWIIIHNTNPSWWYINGKPIVYHYIDDFFGGAPKKYEKIAWWQFNSVIHWFEKLGIPTKASKCIAPCTRFTILGFECDTNFKWFLYRKAN